LERLESAGDADIEATARGAIVNAVGALARRRIAAKAAAKEHEGGSGTGEEEEEEDEEEEEPAGKADRGGKKASKRQRPHECGSSCTQHGGHDHGHAAGEDKSFAFGFNL
jgi:hypothetical protein